MQYRQEVREAEAGMDLLKSEPCVTSVVREPNRAGTYKN